jgi:hypothetical protein
MKIPDAILKFNDGLFNREELLKVGHFYAIMHAEDVKLAESQKKKTKFHYIFIDHPSIAMQHAIFYVTSLADKQYWAIIKHKDPAVEVYVSNPHEADGYDKLGIKEHLLSKGHKIFLGDMESGYVMEFYQVDENSSNSKNPPKGKEGIKIDLKGGLRKVRKTIDRVVYGEPISASS